MEEDEWEKDTDEVQSLDSEDLYETRPNRWRGPGSTWKTLTADERQTHNAIQDLRNRDLSIHLYNVFALKRRPADNQGDDEGLDAQAPDEEVAGNAGDGGDGGDGGDAGETDYEHNSGRKSRWVPPKSWTAWPLRPDRVPEDDFMPNADDGESAFTFRLREEVGPGAALQEVLTASILKTAHARFRSRRVATEEGEDEAGVHGRSQSWPHDAGTASSGLSGNESHAGARDMEVDGESATEEISESPTQYVAVESADDALSSELLAPPARHIIAKLDRTLSILHHSRKTAVNYLVDSSESSDENPSDASLGSLSSLQSRERGAISRSRSQNISKGRRRPRNFRAKQDDESGREMLVRLAREQKKRMPQFSDEETKVKKEKPAFVITPEEQSRDGVKLAFSRTRLLRRMGLRDWGDVMGAAAMAGFPKAVIARATQRCSDLFGQSLDMYTLPERPVTVETKGHVITKYRPGQPIPRDFVDDFLDHDEADDEGEFAEEGGRGRLRTASSTPGARSLSENPESDGSRRLRRERSSSRASHGGMVYCPHRDCKRSIEGFARKANLVRHMQLVHGLKEGSLPPPPPSSEQDSEDEMDGAVHVDGFLRPIKARRGWRGNDGQKRAKNKKAGKRRHSFESSGDGGTGSLS